MRSASLIPGLWGQASARSTDANGRAPCEQRTLDSAGESGVNHPSAMHAVSPGCSMSIDDRPTIAAPDDDPYLWLEEIEGERALAFVEQQNALTLQKFGDAGFAGDRDALAAILDRPDNIPFISRRGGFVYNLWKDANNPRGLWRRTTLAEFRKPDPAWEIILDIDKLAAEENEDWLFAGAQALPRSGARIVSLSRGGSDAAVVARIRRRHQSLCRRRLHAAGGEGRRGSGSMPIRCCCRAPMAMIWRRRRVTPEPSGCGGAAPTCCGAGAVRDHARAHERARAASTAPARRRGYGSSNSSISSIAISGLATKPAPQETRYSDRRRDGMPWRLARGETAHAVDGGNADLRARHRARHVAVGDFWRESAISRSLCEAGTAPRGAALLLGRRQAGDLHSRRIAAGVRSLDAGRRRLDPGKLPGLPEIGVADVWRLDAEEAESNGDLLANIQDPVTPASLMLIEGFAAPVVLKRAPRTFSADGLVVTQHEAVSIDGERIPYVQTGPAALTGEAPVHLNAYGGFGISVRPYYQSAHRQALARTRRHQRHRQYPRRRRVRHALARCRPLCRQAAGA